MTSPAAAPPASQPAPRRGQVWTWGLWDWGSSAFNTIALTFVFSVYLTDSVGADLPGSISVNSWLSWSTAAAGVLIALMAPVIGQSADRAGRRLRSTGLWTAAVVVAMALMFFVRDDYHYLWLGLLLLAVASIFFELAQVSYFALLSQVSTPANVGRVSGFGWSMGYFGGIVLLLLIYLGLIAGDDGGLLGLGTEGGINIRVAMLLAAAWFAVFALPMFFSLPETPATGSGARLGVVGSYRRLLADLRDLYRREPHTVYFLGASALYRDGLNAVFAFGGVIAVTVYGMDPGTVLIFGVVINVVSALGALTGGWLDDRIGPKAVVVGSLGGLVVVGIILLFVSGPNAFWVFGLILGLFVGPAQASSRSYMNRLCPPGHEGQLFGLYATTGRAVSFLAPALIGLFTYLFSSDRAGTVGIVLVLAAGLAAIIPVKAPARSAPAVNAA
ncbi:UMF1 family MFS transporter [Pseudonocardia sediminis]|uniref:UMF1 family MFS transporter n=1 Tax=Pseudonocardia sediminis TaxID=1397368 RepID=A0A4Q7UWS2_PSEST|nr:MFS transporter [Pseudonocardia sediminis]RZT86422.1 UMF1 family MFS transporter [Pseudonocardia sediminis]